MKIVINTSYGGFSISREAAEYMASLGCDNAKEELEESKNDEWYGFGSTNNHEFYDRTNPFLIQAVEELKERANGNFASLKVVKIPDNVDYFINNENGIEIIYEKVDQRYWK